MDLTYLKVRVLIVFFAASQYDPQKFIILFFPATSLLPQLFLELINAAHERLVTLAADDFLVGERVPGLRCVLSHLNIFSNYNIESNHYK